MKRVNLTGLAISRSGGTPAALDLPSGEMNSTPMITPDPAHWWKKNASKPQSATIVKKSLKTGR